MKNRSTGLSLVEVLVATMIISVSIYGMLLALGAQMIAETQQRDRQVLRQLHYQLVREILKNQRDNDIGLILTANSAAWGLGPWNLTCPALNGETVVFSYSVSGSWTTADYTINTTMTINRNGNVFAQSSLKILYPYVSGAGWQSVSHKIDIR